MSIKYLIFADKYLIVNYNVGKDHPRFKDLTGKTFGKLTLIEYVKVKEKNQDVWKWKCLCSCGKFTYTRTKKFLKDKPVQSCASCGRKRMGKTNTIANNGSLRNRLYRTYKRGAISRGYSFNLTPEEVAIITSKNCHYCGNVPKEMIGERHQNKTNEPFFRNGIDRLDNSEGYIVNNCVPCCDICNRMKLDMTYSSFIDQVAKCYLHLSKESSTTIPSGSTSQANGDGKGDPSKEVMI